MNMPGRDKITDKDMTSTAPETTAMVMGGCGPVPRGGGKALIHPQRHNLKNRFELIRTLGEGTYGKVKLACEKTTGEQVAIKYVKKTKIRDETDLNRIRREIRILSHLQHEHIVNIRQVFEKKDRIVLVMDCALGGELYDYLNRKGSLSESETRRIFRQIIAAVQYIHENSIVHRDLKLENIILDSNGNVKIADFGLANYFSYNSVLRTFCGSPLYASPEIVSGKPYHGPEVDVWSLGVVLYTLAYGAMPFESSNLKVLRQQISTGDYAKPLQSCGAASLIHHMLTVNAARRATLPDILNHWWINLGHNLTPDGRQYDPLPSSEVFRESFHQPQCSFDFEKDVKLPPLPNLCDVTEARFGKKSVETSFAEDEMLHDIGKSVPSSDQLVLVDSVSVTAEMPKVFSEKSMNLRWSQTIGNGSEETETKVVQCLAQDHVSHQGRGERKDPMKDVSSGFVADQNANPQLFGMVESPVLRCQKTQRLSSKKTVNVFHSDKKPKRSILKRKGKFSGVDSGCCFMVDDTRPQLREEEKNVCHTLPVDILPCPSSVSASSQHIFPTYHTSQLASASSASLVASQGEREMQPPLSFSPIHSRTACAVHLCHMPINPQLPSTSSDMLYAQTPEHMDRVSAVTSSLTDSVTVPASSVKPSNTSVPSSNPGAPSPDAVYSCTADMNLTKVVRRHKGILKNTSSGSSSNRNSLHDDALKRLSMGSLSSNSSADILDLSYDSGDDEHYVSRFEPASTGPGYHSSLPLEPGDHSSVSLEGDFMALNLEDTDSALFLSTHPHYRDAGFDLSEAKQVVQQALTVISNSQP